MKITPEDLFAYVYGILAQPAYTEHFRKELGTRELRVPITKKPALFSEVVAVGRKLVWLHTYGERFKPGKRALPSGTAKCTKAVSDQPDEYPQEFYYDPTSGTLTVGTGRFKPVAPDIWNFEVSGLQVVSSWLGYRMKRRQGKQSSPLDKIHPNAWTAESTTELLQLLWIIEATLAGYPKQRQLFEQVVDAPLFSGCELPPVPKSAREAPGDDIAEVDQHELDY